MANVGYLVDLKKVTLSDDMTSEIQVFPFGEYDHPVHGKINFDAAKASDIIKNFDAGVRGTAIDIDYDHKQHSGVAAGWIRALSARDNGVFAKVEWTKKAWQHIQDGEYRYFSPEFADEWKHPKTGQVIKNVLFGGGITNRPFLKDILPINMSELGMPSERPQEGKGMDREKLIKLLGLSADASDEQVETAFTELLQKVNAGEETDPALVGAVRADTPEAAAVNGQMQSPQSRPVAASDNAALVKLAENNPAVKALADRVTLLDTQLAATQKALRLSEVNTQVIKLTEGKNALPAVVTDDLTKLLSESDVTTANSFVALLEKIQSSGLVKLGEIGGADPDKRIESDASKKFSDEVAKIMASDKLEYVDAVNRVATLQPQLYAEYRDAAYAFKEN